MCNVKLLLGNEEMTRTTCTAFVPFVDVVFIFFYWNFTKSGGYCSRFSTLSRVTCDKVANRTY